jgi:hypothetical protein
VRKSRGLTSTFIGGICRPIVLMMLMNDLPTSMLSPASPNSKIVKSNRYGYYDESDTARTSRNIDESKATVATA